MGVEAGWVDVWEWRVVGVCGSGGWVELAEMASAWRWCGQCTHLLAGGWRVQGRSGGHGSNRKVVGTWTLQENVVIVVMAKEGS